jgi:hypothetical protein
MGEGGCAHKSISNEPCVMSDLSKAMARVDPFRALRFPDRSGLPIAALRFVEQGADEDGARRCAVHGVIRADLTKRDYRGAKNFFWPPGLTRYH